MEISGHLNPSEVSALLIQDHKSHGYTTENTQQLYTCKGTRYFTYEIHYRPFFYITKGHYCAHCLCTFESHRVHLLLLKKRYLWYDRVDRKKNLEKFPKSRIASLLTFPAEGGSRTFTPTPSSLGSNTQHL